MIGFLKILNNTPYNVMSPVTELMCFISNTSPCLKPIIDYNPTNALWYQQRDKK